MNSYERIRAMVDGKPVDKVGISGWLHMPLVETHPKDFAKETINFTRNNDWDFCKIMYQAFYFTEDYGCEVEYTQDPLVWNGYIKRKAWHHPDDMLKIKPLDVTKGFLGGYLEATKRICDGLKGEVPVIATVFSPLDVIKDNFGFWYPEIISTLIERNPKELKYALESITETEIRWVEELQKAGCDGIFYATQTARKECCSLEEYLEYGKKYSIPILEAANKDMWFNMMHIHGNNDIYFKENMDMNVQAFNWEDLLGERRTTLSEARSMTDKILCCGIELDKDFKCYDDESDRVVPSSYSPKRNDRDFVYRTLWNRLDAAVRDAGGKDKFIFAPGCALRLNDPRYRFTLVKEVVDDYFNIK